MHDQQQAPDALAERRPALAPASPAASADSRCFLRDEPGRRRQHAAPAAMPGHDAGHEQLRRSRCSVGRPPYDAPSDDRRRHQDAERARGGDHAGAEALRIALLDHGRHHDRADRDDGGRRSSPRSRRTSRRPARRPAPRPPCKWPTIEVAKLIIRRATPPWVRKLPARMKNGIAMIAKLSMPVNSFSADALDRHVGHGEQEGQHRQAERDRDRHAGQHQREQQREDDGGAHRRSLRSAIGRRWRWSLRCRRHWCASWCGSSPVLQNVQRTCRKRKHIR